MFANGAVTGAFVQAFNHELHQGGKRTPAEAEADAYDKLDFDPNGAGEVRTALESPIDAMRADDMAADASLDTKARFGLKDPLHNNAADAYRHANWSFRMARALGVDAAKAFGDAHEISAVNPSGERIMDLYNNFVGRQMATMPAYRSLPADTAINIAIQRGFLRTQPFDLGSQ